ncbi:hypothetical protein CFC21_036354, partial [Triticum aestivum]
CPAARHRASWRTSSASSSSSATAPSSAATKPSSGQTSRYRTSPACSGRTSCTTPRTALVSACTGRRRRWPAAASSPCWCTSTAGATASAPSRSPTSTRSASAPQPRSGPSCCPCSTASPPSTASPRPSTTARLSCPGCAARPSLAPAPTRGSRSSADFARTFLSGNSAGANLAHHVTVRAASGQIAVSPARVVGYILLSAFFAGAERTATEADPPAGVSLTTAMADQLWRMSLPVGASLDHPLANPFGPKSPSLAPVELPAALVVAPLSDVLRDRVLGYGARLKDMGKAVEVVQFEGEQHGFSVRQPFGEAADELLRVIKRFVY